MPCIINILRQQGEKPMWYKHYDHRKLLDWEKGIHSLFTQQLPMQKTIYCILIYFTEVKNVLLTIEQVIINLFSLELLCVVEWIFAFPNPSNSYDEALILHVSFLGDIIRVIWGHEWDTHDEIRSCMSTQGDSGNLQDKWRPKNETYLISTF